MHVDSPILTFSRLRDWGCGLRNHTVIPQTCVITILAVITSIACIAIITMIAIIPNITIPESTAKGYSSKKCSSAHTTALVLRGSDTPRRSLHSTYSVHIHRATALTSLALHTPQHLHCSHTPRHSTYIARLAHTAIHHAPSPFHFLIFLKPG